MKKIFLMFLLVILSACENMTIGQGFTPSPESTQNPREQCFKNADWYQSMCVVGCYGNRDYNSCTSACTAQQNQSYNSCSVRYR